ncbi:MAG TPA: hypothetical protein VHT73_18810 [Thermodesulfobacteriota bacterium]|nr:hypothetical protein [Thermodesulfobacteriota bacterium]
MMDQETFKVFEKELTKKYGREWGYIYFIEPIPEDKKTEIIHLLDAFEVLIDVQQDKGKQRIYVTDLEMALSIADHVLPNSIPSKYKNAGGNKHTPRELTRSIPEKNLLYFHLDFLCMRFANPVIKVTHGNYLNTFFRTLNPKYLTAITSPAMLQEEAFWKQINHLKYVVFAREFDVHSWTEKYKFRKQTRDRASKLLKAIEEGFRRNLYSHLEKTKMGTPRKDALKWVREKKRKITSSLTRLVGKITKRDDKKSIQRRIDYLTRFLQSELPKTLGEPLKPFPQQKIINKWSKLSPDALSTQIMKRYLKQKGRTRIAIDERTQKQRELERQEEERRVQEIDKARREYYEEHQKKNPI